MKPRISLWLMAAIFLATVSRAQAQQPGKIPRIGFLDSSTPSGMAVLIDAFRQELNKLGWIEGKNITIEYRFAESKGDKRIKELAAELVRLKVDLIVVTENAAASAAKSATTTIPIVMTSPADPVGTGLVASLARPGGNVTGLSSLARDTQGRHPQACTSWASTAAGSRDTRTPTERAQGCRSSIEAKIGGDRDSTRRQRF
ncbi:MAG TPA: ABC transporter substrate binding protein [Candidatus Binatia bacterium]|nr:ABC transporter substrate binding protein [Candidatus Binatia bacterium]